MEHEREDRCRERGTGEIDVAPGPGPASTNVPAGPHCPDGSTGWQAGRGSKRVAHGRSWAFGRGVLHPVVAVLAAQVALRRGSAPVNGNGAMSRVTGAPLGRALLFCAAAGFAAFAADSLLEAR